MDPRISRLLKKSIAGFEPPPQLSVSEWANKHFYLSSEYSSEVGRYSWERAPYQKAVLDAMSDPSVERISCMFSSQTGKTTMLLIILAYYMVYDPGPILFLEPTLEMAEALSKDRISPMLRDIPALRNLVTDKSKDSGNTILHKKFTGGHLTLAGTNSPTSLSSRPIRNAIFDEIDRYTASAGDEGSPISLAIKRTTTFHNRKLFLVSTPTVDGASNIQTYYGQSNQQEFYVPCPHCGEFQVLRFPNVKCENDNPDTAYYECPLCLHRIQEFERFGMLAKGEWRAHAPEVKGHAGFFLNELYSPWSSFAQLLKDFKEARALGPEGLRAFINTALAETWKESVAEKINTSELAARREFYLAEVPKEVGILTAGVDIGKDHIQISVLGHGRRNHTWLIEHKILQGDPSSVQNPIWREADEFLRKTYTHESGRQIPITSAFVDSGNWTDQVYRFTKSRQPRRIFASKGRSSGAAITKPSTNNKIKAKLYNLGTVVLKDTLYQKLRIRDMEEAGYIHFPCVESIDDGYFKELTSERVKVIRKAGQMTRGYEKVSEGARGEALDCFVYAIAAYMNLNVMDIGREVDRMNGIETPREPEPVVEPQEPQPEEPGPQEPPSQPQEPVKEEPKPVKPQPEPPKQNNKNSWRSRFNAGARRGNGGLPYSNGLDEYLRS